MYWIPSLSGRCIPEIICVNEKLINQELIFDKKRRKMMGEGVCTGETSPEVYRYLLI
jgi:hypothetical protein